MARRKRALPEGVKVAFEALAGRPRGRGILGIEDEGDEVARQAKLERMAERITAYDRGYEGNRRRCPQCGQWQRYKGDARREVVVEGGTLTLVRAYYVCPRCHAASYRYIRFICDSVFFVQPEERQRACLYLIRPAPA